MLLEATEGPIRYRLRDGREIRLEPGQAVEVPDDQARKLLSVAHPYVRPLHAQEPCQAQAGAGKPVFWLGTDGVIRQGTCLLLASHRDEGRLWGWIGAEATDGWHWIREDRLRSRKDFEAQPARPATSCARCGAPAWLRWAGGALLCSVCERGA